MPDSETTLLSATPSLAVSDLPRAVAFFAEAVGFEPLRENGEVLGILRKDAVELHLWVADGSAPGAETYLAGTVSCRIEVRGVEALHEHCRGLAVVHPNAPLEDKPWGTREFGILDPDHNLVTFYERR